jgi:uncharacterized membrane protein
MEEKQRFAPEWLQVLAHFYRGEMQRSTDWRLRLDTTTNWAIVAATATFSWTFGTQSSGAESHIVFFFTSLTVFLLLCLEARRFRHYDVWHTRVRMIEVHLLVPALNPEKKLLEGNWRTVLSNDLLLPSYKISFLEALARRLLNNYIWLFIGLLAGWLLRVYTAAKRDEAGNLTWQSFYRGFGYGEVLAPWQTIGAFAVFWAVLIWLLVRTWATRHVTGEIRRRDPKAKQWPI